MFVNLAEPPDSAAEPPAKFAELKTFIEVWSIERDTERRKFRIEPKSPNPPTPAKAKAMSVR